MTVTIQTFSNGDTDYVAKLNNNFANAKVAVEALQATAQAAVQAGLNPGSVYAALFGATGACLIGETSYLPTPDGTDLDIAAGYAWKAGLQAVVGNALPAVLAFVGQPAATYYVQVDGSGIPSRSPTSTESLYSVVWTGSAFGAITRTASRFMNATEMVAALTSAQLSATYGTLDARLEAGETLAKEGSLSYDYNLGQLTKAVDGEDDVTLTATETNNSILRFTGVLTDNIDVLVPLSTAPRIWLIRNNTTGAFTITLRGASGTGEVVTQGHVVWAYHDGTNVTVIELVQGADIGSASLLDIDTDVTLAANSDSLIATQKATRAYVLASVAALIDSSPGALDTLNELAAALGDDANFASTVTTALGLKAPLASPALTGTPTAPTAAPGTNNTQVATTAYADAAVPATTHAATSKATPVDADEIPLSDSADTWLLKKLTWANLKATVKTYFDTLYAPLTRPFFVCPFYPTTPGASELLGVFPCPANITITVAAALAGSAGKSLVAATAQTDIDVRKNATTSANGTSVGTVRWAAAGTVPTFIAASGFTLVGASGDYLSFWGPATPDVTLAKFSFTLAGTF
jgi:hypothetical protein